MPDPSSEAAPLVTVCVPTIGRAETIVAAFDSLRRQTLSDYETLVLDNASPSPARELIAREAATESRWSVMRSDVRLPMFDNFQRGVDAAAGRYVAFLHDDDVYHEDFLSRHVSFLEAHPDAAFSGSNCTLIDGEGNPLGRRRLVRTTEAWSGWRYIEALFNLGSNLFPMQTIVFRRALLGSGTFASSDSAHFSDFVILMRLAEEHEVGMIAEELMQLREHTDQASKGLEVGAALEQRTRVFAAYCDELLARRPERGREIERLRRHINATRRSSAIWTWLNAPDRNAATASRDALGSSRIDSWIRRCLVIADVTGMGRLLRTRPVRSRLRSAGHSLAGRLT